MKEYLIKQPYYREETKCFFSLCLASSADLLKISESILHASEKKRYNSFPAKIRKQTYLLGRYCAKKAIKLKCGIDSYADINICNGIFDHPLIIHSKIHNTQVSIAHTNNVAVAIAFGESHPMGVDIEDICAERSQTIATQLTDNEKSLKTNLKISEMLFNAIIWTAKEALSKTLKSGLMASQLIYEVKDFIFNPIGYFELQYKCFFQYRAISYIVNGQVLTLCIPKNSKLEKHSILEKSQNSQT